MAALVVLLARDFVALGATVGAIVVTGSAAWLGLTRRGPARAFAIGIVVVGLGAGAAVLVLRDVLDELFVLAVALAVFAVTSRIALRGAVRAQRAGGRRARPERAVLLLNPRSGDGKVERFNLVDEASRRGIEPVVLGAGDDLVAVAREAARSAHVLGMAGGDGSQALVAQVAMEHDLGFVCVPAGTRNHFALDLGLDRNDVPGSLDAFASEHEERVDVAFVNERIFVNNVSLGVYADIVQSPEYRDAKLETMHEHLPDLLGPGAKAFDLRFRGPDGSERRSAQLVLVSNNPYRLGRLAGFRSRERLDSGVLGIVTAHVENDAQFPAWHEWTAEEFAVESGSDVAAGIDGEAITLEPPLRFRIEHGALRVRLPQTAGLSPAALAPGISGLGKLWRIAARGAP